MRWDGRPPKSLFQPQRSAKPKGFHVDRNGGRRSEHQCRALSACRPVERKGERQALTDRRRKLTDDQIAQIRAQAQYGRKRGVIAREFGITREHVWKIVTGWRRKK